MGSELNDSNAMVGVSNGWHVVGTGDFNGDGRSDILWQSQTGFISNWLGTATGGWLINDANALTHYGNGELHIGDFDGDGRYLSSVARGSDGALAMSRASGEGSFNLAWVSVVSSRTYQRTGRSWKLATTTGMVSRTSSGVNKVARSVTGSA